MKSIGLIGGMSWESTAIYYKELNERVNKTLGGLHSAKIHLTSVDFAEIADLQKQEKWEEAGKRLGHVAKHLEAAGADFILICTNTMHKVAEQVETHITVPLLHIADVTGTKITENKLKKIGLLGTQFTMEQAFYTDRLAEKFDIEVVTPDLSKRQEIHRIIFEELCKGKCLPASKAFYLETIKSMEAEGIEAVILGCTEIGMLITENDLQQAGLNLPVYDTTLIHVEKAVEEALKDSSS